MGLLFDYVWMQYKPLLIKLAHLPIVLFTAHKNPHSESLQRSRNVPDVTEWQSQNWSPFVPTPSNYLYS